MGFKGLQNHYWKKKKLSVTTEGSGSPNAILRQKKKKKRQNNRILTVQPSESLFFPMSLQSGEIKNTVRFDDH